MKELLFLRHAKSAWDQGVDDRHRPLQPKGIKAISSVARCYSSTFKSFDYILSSPANRALHTAAILAHQIDFPWENFRLNEHLYSFDSNKIISVIKNLHASWNKVIIVGHNPAFSTAAAYLSSVSVPELKTSDWIHLRFAQKDWSTIKEGKASYGSKKEAQKKW